MVAGSTSIHELVSTMNSSATPVTSLEVKLTDCRRLMHPLSGGSGGLMRGPDHQVDAVDEECSFEILDIWAHDYYLSDPREP
jgi:hypothetical protein